MSSPEAGEKIMLSTMGPLCLSIEINGNLWDHRLYFRSCQLTQSAKISNLDKTTMGTSTCQQFCFSTSCEVKRTRTYYMTLQIVMDLLEKKQGVV